MTENFPHVSTRKLLREYRKFYEQKPLHLRKRLGQHLLANEGMLREIARRCHVTPESHIIEIGAGVGNLTQAILNREPRKYTGVELDERFQPLHEQFFKHLHHVRFIYADILKLDLSELVQLNEDVIIVGNIPYQITSPLIMKLISEDIFWSRMVLTVQKEVGERLTASPGTKKISALTIKVRVFVETRIEFLISARNFIPPPKVDSAVLTFLPYPQPLVSRHDIPGFYKMVTAAFAQKRKTILNSLSHEYRGTLSKDRLHHILVKAEIDPGIRAEKLSLQEYKRLYIHLKEVMKQQGE